MEAGPQAVETKPHLPPLQGEETTCTASSRFINLLSGIPPGKGGGIRRVNISPSQAWGKGTLSNPNRLTLLGPFLRPREDSFQAHPQTFQKSGTGKADDKQLTPDSSHQVARLG